MPETAFPIVGLGFSESGAAALSEVFSHFAARTGMAFVLVSPAGTSPSTFSALAKIPVKKVRATTKLQPGQIYLTPPGALVSIRGAALQICSPGRAPLGPYPAPIDHFFRSLAADRRNHAVAVALSGDTLDGVQGCAAIQSAGGITLARAPFPSEHSGMPHNAIEAECVDFVLPPRELALKLAELGAHLSRGPAVPDLLGDHHIVLACLQEATGVNCSHYAQSALACGITRRMTLNNIATLNEYLRYVNEKPAELRALFRDLLASFTPFFDRELPFDALSQTIFPALLHAHKSPDVPLRIWVPGCSSGEDAYSFAIVLLEVLAAARDRAAGNGASSPPQVQIFATDSNDAALETARAGIYDESRLGNVSSQRLKNFFSPTSGGFLISRSIRDMCIFARQDLANDPPFSRMDLISCRRVLDRLHPRSQKRVIAQLHYALSPAGQLLLGDFQDINNLSDYFTPVDGLKNVFHKHPRSTALVPYFPKDIAGLTPLRGPRTASPSAQELHEVKQAENLLTARYVPASIVVNEDLQVLRIWGHLGPYLEPASGSPTYDLSKIAGESLLQGIRSALSRAKHTNKSVRRQKVPVESKGHVRSVNLELTPISLRSSAKKFYLIVFQEKAPAAASLRNAKAKHLKPAEVAALVRENKLIAQQTAQLRDQLQSATQTHAITSEEYQTAAEELQTTNEELETAKAELQSGNEELRVLNDRLYHRNEELLEAYQDLASVLANVNIPLVIVDRDFHIRRFTPPAQKLLNFQPGDVGRRLREIRPNLESADLEELARDTIEHGATCDCELRETRVGKWFSVRIRPYRASSNAVEGAVLSFHDIDILKRNLDQTRVFADALIENAREALLVLDRDLRVTLANSAFCRLFQISAAETEGRLVYDLGEKQWDIPALRTLLDQIIQHNHRADDFEVCHDFPHLGTRTMCINARRIEPHEDEYLILLAIEDISEKKRQTEALRRLSTYSMRVQDDERRRIARDLHDITGQKLALQSMNLAQMLRKLHDNPAVLSIARECQSLTDQISSEIRTLSYLLHPPLLDELGLGSALHWYAQGFESRTGIRVNVDVPSDLMRLSPETEVTLFRVVQESLTNIHRYASSPTAIIRVNVDAEEMTLEIIDHGKGMEVSREAPETYSAERPGVGIQGMRERMRQLSGRLEIVSVPDHGTRVVAILPVEGLGREPVLDEADVADDVSADESAVRDSDSAALRSSADKKVRVLIADDHEIMRQGVRTLLAGELNWEICGEAVNGREAVEKTFQLTPDLVILDLNMPVLDGLAALREIIAQSPRAKVLVLTVHDSERIIHEIFSAGADGCLLKSQTAQDLVRAVTTVLNGQVFRPDSSNPQTTQADQYKVARSV
ncbi:MAG: CheR family methyltransferase [Candidatus Acidiferrales bacterium]